MANVNANVIFRGQIDIHRGGPYSVNLPVAGAYLPGEFMVLTDNELTRAAAPEGRLFILSNLEFAGQDPDTAYTSGDTGVGYRIEPDQEYTARMAAGTYAKGDPLTVDANGRLAAAVAGDLVIAYFDPADGADVTHVAGDRGDVVIANAYTVPA